MEDLEELKKALLLMEKEARFYEVFAPTINHEASPAVAQAYRIATACMWEKLERMEKEARHGSGS